METNFAPWRLGYIKSDKNEEGCVFCRAFEDQPSFDNLVIFRNELVAVMLNRFPYNNGHILVVPHSHKDSLTMLEKEEQHALSDAVALCESAIRSCYSPDGINIGMNLGQAAGAGIVDHLHYHILPRWHGDTNYVTVIGELRVIPEDLESSYNHLRNFFPSGG